MVIENVRSNGRKVNTGVGSSEVWTSNPRSTEVEEVSCFNSIQQLAVCVTELKKLFLHISYFPNMTEVVVEVLKVMKNRKI